MRTKGLFYIYELHQFQVFPQLENLLPLPNVNSWPDVLTCFLAALQSQTDFTTLDRTVAIPENHVSPGLVILK